MKKFLTTALAVLLSFTVLTTVNAEETVTEKTMAFTPTIVTDLGNGDWDLGLTVDTEGVKLEKIVALGFGSNTSIPLSLEEDGTYVIKHKLDEVIVQLLPEEVAQAYQKSLEDLIVLEGELAQFFADNGTLEEQNENTYPTEELNEKYAELTSNIESCTATLDAHRSEYNSVTFDLIFELEDGGIVSYPFGEVTEFTTGNTVTVQLPEEPEVPEVPAHSIKGTFTEKTLDGFTLDVEIIGEGVSMVDVFAIIDSKSYAVANLEETATGFTYSFNEHYHLMNLLEGAELEAYEAAYAAAQAEVASRTTNVSAQQALQAIKNSHITYKHVFANEEDKSAVAMITNIQTELVDNAFVLTFVDGPIISEEDDIRLIADLSEIEWIVGETVQFSDITFYLVNFTQITYVEIDFEDITIIDNNNNVTTEYFVPNVFHDDMNGKVFTAVYEDASGKYIDVFDTSLYLPKGVSASFDSLNVSINYGLEGTAKNNGVFEHILPDQEYLKSKTTYQSLVLPETSHDNGKLYTTSSQEVVFQKPGTYNIPLVHVTVDADNNILSTTKLNDSVQVIVSASTNEKLDVKYEGSGSKFDVNNVKVSGNISGENHGISVDTSQLFIYDDNNNLVDKDYVMTPGQETTLHVTYYPNKTGRLLNSTVHYGSTIIKLDKDGNVVAPTGPTAPTTPPTGLANYAGYYVLVASLAAVVVLMSRKTRKENY